MRHKWTELTGDMRFIFYTIDFVNGFNDLLLDFFRIELGLPDYFSILLSSPVKSWYG